MHLSSQCLLRMSLPALLSPILHAFRDIGGHQLTLVACGTGLSVNTLFWVQSSGSGLKDSSFTFEVCRFWFAFINWQNTRLLRLKKYMN